MKILTAFLAGLTLIVFLTDAPAGPPIWPRQPKLSSAYESLTVALKQIERSREGSASRHLGNASAALVSARANLDTAKKNKGSAAGVAIKLVDQASLAVKEGRTGEAADYVTQAMEKVSQAARNGR